MHLHSESESRTTIRAQDFAEQRMINTCWVQIDLVKVCQVHLLSNLCENLPRCSYVVNMKDLKQLGPSYCETKYVQIEGQMVRPWLESTETICLPVGGET
jgi:hypothetical protein